MYKDKDKQREANRKAQAKFKAKGITTQSVTECIADINRGKGITNDRVLPAPSVIPERTAQGNIRVRQQRRRDVIKSKGVTLTMEEKAARFNALIADKPKRGKDTRVIPKTFQENAMDILEEKAEPERTAQGNIRVSKPGDADYTSCLSMAEGLSGLMV